MNVKTRNKIARFAGECMTYLNPARMALHISSPWTAARWGGRFHVRSTQAAATNESPVSKNDKPAPRSPGTKLTTTPMNKRRSHRPRDVERDAVQVDREGKMFLGNELGQDRLKCRSKTLAVPMPNQKRHEQKARRE